MNDQKNNLVDQNEYKPNRHERRKVYKTGLSPENIKQQEHTISRAAFNNAVIPNEGSMVEGYKVSYRNPGKLRFTCTCDILPSIGTELNFEGKRYIIDFIGDKKFSATFNGFKQEEKVNIPDAPSEITNDNEITKVI
jgi:hypothetical protein